MNKTELLKIIYKQKDYLLAEKLCFSKTDDEHLILLARTFFYDKKYQQAEVLFKKLHRFVEYGYCKLYQGDKQTATKIWNSIDNLSPLTEWVKALSKYLDKDKSIEPTFFQVRNFYETDLDTLLNLKMTSHAENLINCIQHFSDINPEIYKFTARVLFNNKYYFLAEKFIEAAKRCVFEDPELHFLDAQLRLAQNMKISAIKSLETVLDIEPTYYPAKKLLTNIK